MPSLHSLAPGDRARVRAVADQPLRVRMESMGLRPGAEVSLLSRSASGSRIVKVGDARLTLARELARSIEVEPLDVQ